MFGILCVVLFVVLLFGFLFCFVLGALLFSHTILFLTSYFLLFINICMNIYIYFLKIYIYIYKPLVTLIYFLVDFYGF